VTGAELDLLRVNANERDRRQRLADAGPTRPAATGQCKAGLARFAEAGINTQAIADQLQFRRRRRAGRRVAGPGDEDRGSWLGTCMTNRRHQ
jgi:hypothetical protein